VTGGRTKYLLKLHQLVDGQESTQLDSALQLRHPEQRAARPSSWTALRARWEGWEVEAYGDLHYTLTGGLLNGQSDEVAGRTKVYEAIRARR